MKNDLKELSNPKKYNNPISINNQDANTLQQMLSTMLLIRKTEQQLALCKKNDSMLGEIYVSKIFRNKNLATVMSLFLLNRTYNHYQNIFYVCNKGNIASIRLAKKCGFESSEY